MMQNFGLTEELGIIQLTANSTAMTCDFTNAGGIYTTNWDMLCR